MGEVFLMNGNEFFISLLWLISIDIIIGFLIFMLYKYVDLKYFSNLEIEQLKTENKYLKEENQKIKGTSTNFWSDKE